MPEQEWIVLDTDVWSSLFASKRRDARVDRWRELLKGQSVVVATQTRAEVMAGILASNLGESRANQIRKQLDETRTVPVDEGTVLMYAALTAQCRSQGHALHAKQHTADRWIAATAVAIGAPLLSGDGIFRDAPLLTLLTDVPI